MKDETYHLGQTVIFDGRLSTVIAVSDRPGILTVSNYAGSWIIADVHPRLRALPAIGERVIIDATLLGEAYAVEVVVVGIRGVSIIGRPEGATTLFTRSEWRPVAS